MLQDRFCQGRRISATLLGNHELLVVDASLTMRTTLRLLEPQRAAVPQGDAGLNRQQPRPDAIHVCHSCVLSRPSNLEKSIGQVMLAQFHKIEEDNKAKPRPRTSRCFREHTPHAVNNQNQEKSHPVSTITSSAECIMPLYIEPLNYQLDPEMQRGVLTPHRP